MASTAYTAQGTTFVVGSTGTSKSITAATKANPVVLTITSHGYANGTILKVTGVTGMTELNNKVGVVTSLSANSVSLKGIDSTNYTTYTSGGTATPNTFTVGNVRTFSLGGASKSQVDVTNLASTAKEYIGGLGDSGTASLEFDYKASDEGQQALWSSYNTPGTSVTLKVTYSDNSTETFSCESLSFDRNGGVDDSVKGASQLKISGSVMREGF
jgi:hypothetical protein